jgi:hypothetical protein
MSGISWAPKDVHCALATMRRTQRGRKTHLTELLRSRVSVLIASILGIGVSCHAAVLPASTAVPVQFTHTIDAGKIAPGATVIARSIQAVSLPDGQVLPKGASVVGHVVESRPFIFDPKPYATQQPSYLSIHFDKIVAKGLEMALNVSVRALADPFASYEASTPHFLDETDTSGTMVQIGGDQFSARFGKELLSPDGDIVGYIRNHEVYGRLVANTYISQYASSHCDSTATEQSLAIFSPKACGLYGFGSIYMPDNGRKDGTFRLESRRHTVELYRGSVALLEVN